MSEEIALKLADHLRSAISKRGQASLIVCGGSSPLPIFSRLQNQGLDWSKVMISLVDDRLVDDEDEASNVKLVKTHLMKGAVADAQFISLKSCQMEDISSYLPFDVVLLGMGVDGHFASLFPEMIGQDNAFSTDAKPMIITTPPYGSPKVERISMNMALILEAQHLYMIVAGEEKNKVWDEALNNDKLPVYYLRHQSKTKIHVIEGLS